MKKPYNLTPISHKHKPTAGRDRCLGLRKSFLDPERCRPYGLTTLCISVGIRGRFARLMSVKIW